MVQKKVPQWRQRALAAVVAMAAGLHGGQAALAAGPEAAAVAVLQAGKAGIYPDLAAGDRVVADVIVDGKVVGKLDHQAAAGGGSASPALVFALPPATKRVRLRGQATVKGQSAPFDRSWKLRDLGRLSAPLYDTRKPWIERIRGLSKVVEEGVSVERIDAKALKKPASALFADLEKSLGVPLPPLVRVLGDWSVDTGHSSGFVTAAGMVKVTDMLVNERNHELKGPRGLDRLLDTGLRARYDRSLVVYQDMNSGMGALAWDPAGIVPGEKRGTWQGDSNPVAQPGPAGQGVWFWMSEKNLDQSPRLLLGDDLRPMTAEAAMTHVFECSVLSDESSRAEAGELMVDTATPKGSRLALDFEGPGQPRLALGNYDYHDCLY
jgi:hypothetical protein